MALATKLGRDIPEGAVVVSREEALDYQRAVVQDWPRINDVIFLKYGSEISLVTTLVSSGVVFDYFRRAFNVQAKRYAIFLAPTLILPAFVSSAFTTKVLTNDTLLMKIKCPMCSQIKFALGQAYLGLIFPGMYGIASFTAVAKLTNCYNFGKADTDARIYWKEMYKITKGGTRSYQIAGLLQILLVLTLPFMQNKELVNIMNKLNETSDSELLVS